MRYRLIYEGIPSDTESEYCIEPGKIINKQVNAKDCLLCQCSGLKDCEGNYIYENDVLTTPDEKCIDFNYVVEFDFGEFFVAVSGYDYEMSLFDYLHEYPETKILGQTYRESKIEFKKYGNNKN